MIPSETLRMAASNLWGHKVRSLLTILGVVIGVSSVLAVTTIATSFEASVLGQFDDLDNRAVFAAATLKESGGRGPPDAGAFGDVFTSRDAATLRTLPNVERVVAEGRLPITGFSYGGKTLVFNAVTATSSDAGDLHARVGDAPRYAAGGTFRDGKAQIVIGDTVARILGNLSGTPVTVGATVGVLFPDGTMREATVAGILAKSATMFGSQNTAVFVPLDPFYSNSVTSPVTGQKVQLYGGLTIYANAARNTNQVRDAVKLYMGGNDSDASRLLADEAELTIVTQGDITRQIGEVFDQFTIFTNAIAGVSLVVGAIGIANIMLVSVTERTREIGVMKAIGAKDGAILGLFLLEAILIGLVGALVGIALGLGLAVAIVAGLFDIPVVIGIGSLVGAIVTGLVVGVVAGFIPARRATRIQPIKALSYE